MRFISTFLDLLFPRLCYKCRTKLAPENDVLCNECSAHLHFLEKICPVCGEILSSGKCVKCGITDFHFDLARSLYNFDPLLQKLIHEFKYNEMTAISKFLAKEAAIYLDKYNPFSKIDYLVPIPLHRVKKRMRGFNQAELLTRHLAPLINCEHVPKLVVRNRFTTTQTKLNRSKRKQNVADAFMVNKRYIVKGKSILIMDDVFTTGATTNSISKMLKESGAAKVYVLTIARA